MLPIRGLLSFVRHDELVSISTWNGELGQAGLHLRPIQTCITLILLDSHASYAT